MFENHYKQVSILRNITTGKSILTVQHEQTCKLRWRKRFLNYIHIFLSNKLFFTFTVNNRSSSLSASLAADCTALLPNTKDPWWHLTDKWYDYIVFFLNIIFM